MKTHLDNSFVRFDVTPYWWELSGNRKELIPRVAAVLGESKLRGFEMTIHSITIDLPFPRETMETGELLKRASAVLERLVTLVPFDAPASA